MEEPQQFAESEERGLLLTLGFSNNIFSNPNGRNVFFINIVTSQPTAQLWPRTFVFAGLVSWSGQDQTRGCKGYEL